MGVLYKHLIKGQFLKIYIKLHNSIIKRKHRMNLHDLSYTE